MQVCENIEIISLYDYMETNEERASLNVEKTI
jgi:hypothetical protein